LAQRIIASRPPTARSFLLFTCCVLISCAATQRPPGPEARRRLERPPPGTEPAPTQPVSAGYHPYAEFTDALQRLATESAGVAQLESLATTVGGREVWLLTLAAAGESPPEQRQALLIVGGLDATHPASSETALGVAVRLVRAQQDDPDGPAARLLRERTIYIVPRANPDGIERYFESIKHESPGNARAIDEDRDGVIDEDGPDDLNHDGLITVMRVPDPEGEWLPDPDEPRLLKRADRAKGESGQYKLYLEGIDNDADGQINEDGPGGVNLDRNWPHLYEPGVPKYGPHAVSEAETRGLAEFVVGHPHISAAVVFGRNDSIVKVPHGKERGPAGQAYRDLHPDDVPRYEHISRKFREITALEGSPGCDPAGAFYAWLYAQRAIPTFATTLWWPLRDQEPAKARTQPASRAATRPTPGAATAPQSKPRGAQRRGRPQGRRSGPSGGGGEPKRQAARAPDDVAARVLADDLHRKWLAYSDTQRGGAGFVEWTPVEHPEFGTVEVGGFVPFFMTTPPAHALPQIAEQQVEFLVALSEMLPALRFGSPTVKHLGADLWQIELPLVNDGYLPTHCGIALHTRQPPVVVRPLIDADRIVGGPRMARVENVEGNGGVRLLRWLIRGRSGERIPFRAFNRVYGERRTEVPLEQTASETEDTP